MLGPEKWNNRENYIEELLCPKIQRTDLFSINDVLQTKFQEPAAKGKILKKCEKMKNILTTLIKLVSLFCYIRNFIAEVLYVVLYILI